MIRAYQNGTLDELANAMTDAQKAAAEKEGLTNVQYYYKHHCPSFTSVQQKVSLAVQGTSSQAYPRRNYKAKFKASDDVVYMYMNRGPFADDFSQNNLDLCHLDFFYYNNYSVGTTKFTFKIDFMESSGTYNMGFANLVHTAYEKHPIDDYNKVGAFNKATTTYELATDATPTEGTKYYEDNKGKVKVEFTDEVVYTPNKYYIENTTYDPYNFDNTAELRTNVQGFPVMGFWKYGDTSNDYRFIGRYNMLLDKGSDEAYGFKPSKSITQAFAKNKTVRKIAECWEFSNNQRGFCSFKDPSNHHKLAFDYTYSSEGVPVISGAYEYRYNTDDDLIDYLYGDVSLEQTLVNDGYNINDLSNVDWKTEQLKKIYANWEKANQWVWSTNTDNVPAEAEKEKARKIMDYVKVDIGTAYDSSTTYYDQYEDEITDMTSYYDGDNNIQKEVYIGVPKTVKYGETVYEYETKEYRLAKFKEEFSKHFNLDYSLIYFVMTEVMLAYDSRGKNCMMASWGPQEPGGDYIWYPVFYDMDTQLGINNTGIPSFEYSANATEDGTFSTSDSVLWNNLYKCFYTNIVDMYDKLRGLTIERGGVTSVGPLSSVNHIENWYLAQPYNDQITDTQREKAKQSHFEMCGDRPLAMFNMDEQYKYISITNSTIGYQLMGGGTAVDNGSYYYALQGDRSLSRQQFLSRRINFIDSWFGVRNFKKDSGPMIYGRTGANYNEAYSDIWVTEPSSESQAAIDEGKMFISEYYKKNESGEILKDANGRPIKVNYLDADNYIAIEPYQKSYVKVYVDDDTYGSKEYNNAPVYYDLPRIDKSALNKYNMRENLTYVTGGDSVQDLGDISLLYWSQFYAENAPHLSRLLLGNDHPNFYNKGVFTDPKFDANATTLDGGVNTGKPLLKEVNLTGIGFSTADQVFDFTSAEKMRIFKGLRSNFAEIKFADGVALHTLYLPSTVKTLTLTEANNLTTVLGNINVSDNSKDDYYSKYNEITNEWTAKQGLYIAGLTNLEIDKTTEIPSTLSCNLSQIDITGGALGYGLYDIIYALYRIYKEGESAGSKDLKISLRNIDWSPYKQVDEGTYYESSKTYYKDDGHYGFTVYEYSNGSQWNIDLTNGLVYTYDETEAENSNKLTDINMLLDFIQLRQYKNITSTEDLSVPVLTGNIYINNSDPIDEYQIRNTLLNDTTGFSESNLNIHFAKVDKKYKATFIQEEADGTQTVIGTEVLSEPGQFTSPYSKYRDAAKRDNYDFLGWSTSTKSDDVIGNGNMEDLTGNDIVWRNNTHTSAVEGIYDYTFYAVFVRHEFTMQFKVGTTNAGFTDACSALGVLYGDYIVEPNILPYLDDSALPEEERYTFIGWTQDRTTVIARNRNTAKLVNVNRVIATSDMTFYAVFVQENVYDSVLDNKYLSYTPMSNGQGYRVALNLYNETTNPTGIEPSELRGKITLPASYNGLPILQIGSNYIPSTMGGNVLVGGFADCVNLTYVFFEEGSQLTTISSSAFNRCTSLVDVKFPDTLTSIEGYVFSQCHALKTSTFNCTTLAAYMHSGSGIDTANAESQDQRVPYNFVIGPKVEYMGGRAFNSYRCLIDSVQFGTETEGSNLYLMGDNAITTPIFYNTTRYPRSITCYYGNETCKEFFESMRDKNLIIPASATGVTWNILPAKGA